MKSKALPRLLTACVLLATLTVSSVLTCCGPPSRTDSSKLNLYAPDVLRLPEGVPVKTVDGIHTPQTDEVWHSDRRFRILERNLLYQTK